MNRFVFKLSTYTLKTFSGFSRAKIQVRGEENIPKGSVLFCANHFTRIETIFLPYHIHEVTGKEVWSLAAQELFQVPVLEDVMRQLGAVSTHDPDRDTLILKHLLSGEFHWLIFPEGMMVKNKKLVHRDTFALRDEDSVRSPHTGAALLALRCAFFRERLRRLKEMDVPELDRLCQELAVEDLDGVLNGDTHIVPVNITYYPANPRKNILANMAGILMKEPSKRVMDELLTEGAMLFTGAEITIRFGEPIPVEPWLNNPYLESMLSVKRPVRFADDLGSKEVSRRICKEIMARYMARVYALTTINYDHVMACVLKHLPYQADGVPVSEFATKVYLGVNQLVSARICALSDHFEDNQSHLLTDDRFQRISTFLKLAEETLMIRIEGDRLFKDHTRFVNKEEFHAIRMENPIRVMANEVEPLQRVEDLLKSVARMTEEEVDGEIRGRIKENMAVEFSRDYGRYYIEGESKRQRVGRPIILEHNQPRAGVLLVHGYMAAPREMEEFARFLHDKGYMVVAPRLAGHGTAPEDLARTRHEDWMDSVEDAYLFLRHSCEKRIIGGFSTGAGLALELATRVSDYEAAFAIAPPMQLKDMATSFVPAINVWNSIIKKVNLASMAKDFVENRPENPHINYLRNPIPGILQLEQLMDRLEDRLDRVKKPVLVAQSRRDPVVNPKGTRKLFDRIGSEHKEFYLFDLPRHGILLGEGSERIHRAVEDFISQYL